MDVRDHDDANKAADNIVKLNFLVKEYYMFFRIS